MATKQSVLVGLVLLAIASPAAADVFRVDVPSRPGVAASVTTLDDGSFVYRIQGLPPVRLAPGSGTLEPYLSPYPPDAIPAGQGYFVSEWRTGPPSSHCCFTQFLSAKLTWYPSIGAPGQVLRECTEYCSSCPGGVPARVDADDTHAVIMPLCGGTAVIRDLASGTETPLDYENLEVTGLTGRLVTAKHAYAMSGFYAIDWRTGERVYDDIPGSGWLLDDESYYTTELKFERRLLRYRPGEPEPAVIPVVGEAMQVDGSGILTRVGNPAGRVYAWELDGTLIGSLGEVPGPYAFAGRRVASVQSSCLTTRLTAWDIGGPQAPALHRICGIGRVRAVTAGPSRIRVLVECRARDAQGCMGKVSLERPLKTRPRSYEIRAGQRRWITVARLFSTRRCQNLAETRRWRVFVDVPEVLAPYDRRVTVTRRNACA